MASVNETFELYVQMRGAGKNAKSTLEALRDLIETLSSNERADMVKRVKQWEGQRSVSEQAVAVETAQPTNKGKGTSARAKTSANCPRCNQPNPSGELFCSHCGYFLGGDSSPHETTLLGDEDKNAPASDYFGPDSILHLVSADNNTFSVQPQRFRHETVVGRAEGGTMRPDIDLSELGASQLGVSRLHVALQYNATNHLLSVSDMKSANGTFINGQKLYPQEVRVLRDGDELRLGHLVLRAYFEHPNMSH